jgi:hypothetical protein
VNFQCFTNFYMYRAGSLYRMETRSGWAGADTKTVAFPGDLPFLLSADHQHRHF